MTNIAIVNFNSGEMTPEADARKDIEKYVGGCRRCENMIPDVYGNATKRPGTEFIASELDVMEGRYPNTIVADGGKAVVLDGDYQELYILDDEGSDWPRGGIRSADIDRDGNYVTAPDANAAEDPMIVLYDSDGTELYRDFPHTEKGNTGVIRSVRFSKDSTYVYAGIATGIFKWKMSDRSVVYWVAGAGGGNAAHPTNDEYVITSRSRTTLGYPENVYPGILDGDGTRILKWSDFGGYSFGANKYPGSSRIVCSPTHAFFPNRASSPSYDFPPLLKMSLTDADDVTYFYPSPGTGEMLGRTVYLYGDYVYLLTYGTNETTGANIWKLNQSDLSIDESIEINGYANSIWIGHQGRLGVKWHNAYTGHARHISLYDSDDLSFIETINTNSTEVFAGSYVPYNVHNIPGHLRPTWGT